MEKTLHSVVNGVALVVCAVSFLLSAFAVNAADGCSVLNGDFEAIDANGHVVDWAYDPSYYSVDQSGGRNGTKALMFSSGRNAGSPLLQRVKVVQGVRYRFGAWVRTEGLEGKGFCARVCLLWEDEFGRFIDGAYNTPHISGTTDGWKKCEGIAPKAPAKAAWVTVRPEVVGPAKGKAWFDDVFYEPFDTKPVSALFTSAYRGEQGEGFVTLAAALNIVDPNVDTSGRRHIFSYMAADGTRKTVLATQTSSAWASVDVPVADLAMGEQAIEFALMDAKGKTLGSVSCPFTRTKSEHRRRVTFDRIGRTIVDGKPFFPLGMYWSVSKPYHPYQLPVIDTNSILTYAKGPFNCVMPYKPPTREQLDICNAHGIKVIYPSYDRKTIATFKEHPALLAWYVNDEKGIEHLPDLTRRYLAVKESDPDHPAWMCVYQYAQIRDLMPTFDCMGVDPYPIPSGEIGMGYTWAKTAHEGTMGMRPLWYVPQAFDWASFRTDGKGRMPTRDEMRNMAWQGIAGGANGLVFYSYTYLMKSPTTPFDKGFADVCAVAQEVRNLFPVLLSDGTPPIFAVKDDNLAVRTWCKGGKLYLLAVNRTCDELKGTVMLREDFTNAKAIMGEGFMKAEGRVLSFAFKPIGVTMLELDGKN